jgi:hypothetical protein
VVKALFPSVPCRRRLFKSRVCTKKTSKEGRGVAERSGGLAHIIRGMERVLGARGEEQRIDWLKGEVKIMFYLPEPTSY